MFYIRSSLQKSHQCTYLHAGTLAKLLQISVITLTLHLTNLQQKNKQQANTNKPYALIKPRQPFDSFLSTPRAYTFHTLNEPRFRWLSIAYRFLTHVIIGSGTTSFQSNVRLMSLFNLDFSNGFLVFISYTASWLATFFFFL